MSRGGEQRYPDHRGWLRNCRAVVADRDGLCVERWFGAPYRVAWGDVVSARWLAGGRAQVQTVHGHVCFGSGVERLDALMAQIDGHLAERGASVVAPADVRRWLGGFTSKTTGESASVADVSVGVGCVAVVALATCVGLLGMDTATWPAVALIAAVLVPLLVAMGRPTGPRRPCSVAADGSGLVVQWGEAPVQSFDWTQVVGLTLEDGCAVVRLVDGQEVALPDEPGTQPVVEALQRIMLRRQALALAGGHLPDGALSSADPAADDPADRGLSQAEEVDA